MIRIKSIKTGLTVLAVLGVLGVGSGRAVAQGDFRALFEKGVREYSKGQYPQAIETLRSAIEINQNVPQAYNYLGLAHTQNNSPLEETVWCFQVAANMDPSFAEAYSNMGRAYYQHDKPDEAEAACLKALDIDPRSLSAKMTLAWVYLLGKPQPENAVKYFSEVLEKIKSPMVYFGLGMAASQSGDNARVLEMVTSLRTMGEDELAQQLESSIRAPVMPSPGQATQIPVPAQPLPEGQIIASGVPQPPAAPSFGGESSSDERKVGTMRIRLKAKLNEEELIKEQQESPRYRKHPGSL